MAIESKEFSVCPPVFTELIRSDKTEERRGFSFSWLHDIQIKISKRRRFSAGTEPFLNEIWNNSSQMMPFGTQNTLVFKLKYRTKRETYKPYRPNHE